MAARVREFIGRVEKGSPAGHGTRVLQNGVNDHEAELNRIALDLFAFQFHRNPPYRALCESRGIEPAHLAHWQQIPAMPAAAFKELEISCLGPEQRSTVFHSSGTTEQRPSRHFHNHASLEVYEASLWAWFARHFLSESDRASNSVLLLLTPSTKDAPHSSLVHMFQIIRQRLAASESQFLGHAGSDGAWNLNFNATLRALDRASAQNKPVFLLGTAFSFVHLLDYLSGQSRRVRLPSGSKLMETGGYKGRSRSLPKQELHRLLGAQLGIPPETLVCEYGMSELSSQAYAKGDSGFQFPPWTRVEVISPETGEKASEGEPGLLRIVDLANVASVLAIQTEDLGCRRSGGIHLLGRAALAEPRGCSLMVP